ncbi:hypothetical protein F2P81_015896 [Scophthalmus maximus]|uniref:Uncharacterized protein n=1 Tax=Scophthalmus maximus TaxID=52904 RepID=A0A6A4SJP8_SCOMX|nr:hypothetical protein F2P81_015896 [Scophthalmus maximus]
MAVVRNEDMMCPSVGSLISEIAAEKKNLRSQCDMCSVFIQITYPDADCIVMPGEKMAPLHDNFIFIDKSYSTIDPRIRGPQHRFWEWNTVTDVGQASVAQISTVWNPDHCCWCDMKPTSSFDTDTRLGEFSSAQLLQRYGEFDKIVAAAERSKDYEEEQQLKSRLCCELSTV